MARWFPRTEILRLRAAVKNSSETANVRGTVLHAVVAPHRGMTTQNDTLSTRRCRDGRMFAGAAAECLTDSPSGGPIPIPDL